MVEALDVCVERKGWHTVTLSACVQDHDIGGGEIDLACLAIVQTQPLQALRFWQTSHCKWALLGLGAYALLLLLRACCSVGNPSALPTQSARVEQHTDKAAPGYVVRAQQATVLVLACCPNPTALLSPNHSPPITCVAHTRDSRVGSLVWSTMMAAAMEARQTKQKQSRDRLAAMAAMLRVV